MGQYFQLINVDRREAQYMGKLGEAIYNYANLPILQLLLRQESQDDPTIGIWAGHRIITAGDYMGECPEGMLSEAEQAEVNHFADTTGRGSHGAFYYFAYRTFKDIPVSPSRGKLPREPNFVLRNLSMHVYVRINDFERILGEKISNEGLDPDLEFTLNILILVNTSWSDDPSCSINCSSEIVPGPWAGNRFDVTPIAELESEGELWKDVTEEQVERIFEIVEGEC
ncbi:hypothetical protein F5887DRAFT_130946 [Amanita rubescens]|nr:hypothetical protein F5887DRAFT_130946 [Amanita rubescens]